MKSNILRVLSFALICPVVSFAQRVDVVVNPLMAQHFYEITSLEREKFFNLHESPGSISGKDLEELTELGVTMGRGTMSPFAGSNVVRGTTDDEIRRSAQRWIESMKRNNTPITPDLMKGVILTSHATPKASAGGRYAFEWKGLGADYSDEAKYAERFFRITFEENGIKVPTYYEPMNEPFVKSSHYDGVSSDKIITEMCRYHQQLAHHLKQKFPDMKVGGFGGAWPFFEGFNSDFVHWDRRMKQYIDIAGEDSDYFSFHIYDGRNVMGDEAFRSGSNMEGLIDIVEGYTSIKFGERKPILISEHGMTHKGMTGNPHTRERDWRIIRALNHQSVQFMMRPDNIEKVIPFVLVKGLWGRENGYPYPWVLQHQDGKGGWRDTDLYRYFEFWSDLGGDYIYANSSEIDILSMAFADDKRLQIVLNNLEEDRVVNLSLQEIKRNKIASITVRSLYGEDDIATIAERKITAEELENLNIRCDETLIVTVKYAKSIKTEGALCAKRFYATSYLKSIKANEVNSFEVNIERGEIASATLKIGVARPSGMEINPVLMVGDREYPFPTDWKGYDQKSRVNEGFFGVIDVEVDPADLSESNTISLKFNDDGGTISTVAAVVNYGL